MYFFGKGKDEEDTEKSITQSSKQTKKRKSSQAVVNPERIIAIDEEMLLKPM